MKKFLLATLMLFSFNLTAQAQESATDTAGADDISTPAMKRMRPDVKGTLVMDGHCAADIQKFCPNTRDGKGGLKKCLLENKDQLSAPCQEQMKEHRKERRERRKARQQQN